MTDAFITSSNKHFSFFIPQKKNVFLLLFVYSFLAKKLQSCPLAENFGDFFLCNIWMIHHIHAVHNMKCVCLCVDLFMLIGHRKQ